MATWLKQRSPRIHQGSGAPRYWAYGEGPRRTFAGDSGEAGDVSDLAGNYPAGVRSSGCAWSSGPAGAELACGLGGNAGIPGYVDITSGPIIAGLSAWTMAAWFATRDQNSNPDGRSIYCERSVSGSGNDILKIDAVTTFGFPNRVGVTYRNDGGTLLQVAGTTAINDGALHHVAITLGGGVISVYVDGAIENSAAWASNNLFTDPLIRSRIGGDYGDDSATWIGAIPGVSLYRRTLSAAEVGLEASDPDWRLRAPRRRPFAPAGSTPATVAASPEIAAGVLATAAILAGANCSGASLVGSGTLATAVAGGSGTVIVSAASLIAAGELATAGDGPLFMSIDPRAAFVIVSTADIFALDPRAAILIG